MVVVNWIGVLLIFVCSFMVNASDTVDVVLLAGQSNMAGGGNYQQLDQLTKDRVERAAKRVQLSFNGGAARPLSYYDNKPTEKYNFTKRFGPELMLGVILAEQFPDKTFLLIKRSQGGTALYGAWNPNWSAEQSQQIEKGFKKQLKLYQQHVADIDENLSTLERYRIIGMVWMQGENDAMLQQSAASYGANLRQLIQAYRQQFNVPLMPFVFGQINSRYGVQGGADLVRKGMMDVAQSDLWCDIVPTSTDTTWPDFPKHLDNVHYNTEGQKRLGEALANQLVKLLSKQAQVSQQAR